MTKRESYLAIRDLLTDADLVEFIDHEIALLDKKAENAKNAVRKPTANQLANEKLKTDIVNYVRANANSTIADIRKHFDLTSQKITPLVKDLTEDHKLVEKIDKRVATYSIA